MKLAVGLISICNNYGNVPLSVTVVVRSVYDVT